MSLKNQNPTQTKAWKKLKEIYQNINNVDMKTLFLNDNKRKEKYSFTFNDFSFDFSKNRIDDDVFEQLFKLANEVDLKDGIDKMFSGDFINTTENRAVLHTALRNKSGKPVLVNNKNIMPEVDASLQKMEAFSNSVISGEFKGYSGKRITDIVNNGG